MCALSSRRIWKNDEIQLKLLNSKTICSVKITIMNYFSMNKSLKNNSRRDFDYQRELVAIQNVQLIEDLIK